MDPFMKKTFVTYKIFQKFYLYIGKFFGAYFRIPTTISLIGFRNGTGDQTFRNIEYGVAESFFQVTENVPCINNLSFKS